MNLDTDSIYLLHDLLVRVLISSPHAYRTFQSSSKQSLSVVCTYFHVELRKIGKQEEIFCGGGLATSYFCSLLFSYRINNSVIRKNLQEKLILENVKASYLASRTTYPLNYTHGFLRPKWTLMIIYSLLDNTGHRISFSISFLNELFCMTEVLIPRLAGMANLLDKLFQMWQFSTLFLVSFLSPRDL